MSDDNFLSRVFGLHSVYNRLHDNYQYYDDDHQSINLMNLSTQRQNLLDSEDESSESEGSGSGRSGSGSLGRGSFVSGTALAGPRTSGPRTSGPRTSTLGPAPTPTPTTNFNPKETPLYKPPRLKFHIPPKERALYLWANITNMDEFLTDIYHYYRGKGLKNILLSRIVDLLVFMFILWFSIFLKWGVNYSAFNDYNPNYGLKLTLSDLIIPHYYWNNVPFSMKLFLMGFIIYIGLRLVQLYFDYKYKLKEIQNFYHQLIHISDDDELMTISWFKIIEKILLLKDYNSLTSSNNKINDLNSKIRLNAHDIANRIMRKENYLIALINKDILDLSINLGPITLNNSTVLTRTLEWNLKLCIFNFIFNTAGQINPNILKDFNRNQLSMDLNKRFKMAAIINLILCPFIVTYFVLLYFFKYFNEYRINPSSLINLRQFTPYAQWKLREFNELPHFFHKRLKLSVNPSNTYINQFPSNFLIINSLYLINFISGSITAILVVFGLLLEDEDHSFWSFELTENKSTLFYISIFGTLFAITSNSSQENSVDSSNSFYYDPEASLRYVAQFTHYLPSSWNGKLHTQEVKNQ